MIKAPRFNLCLSRLTGNTYVLVVLPPGEVDINCVRVNVSYAREKLAQDAGAEDEALEGYGGLNIGTGRLMKGIA